MTSDTHSTLAAHAQRRPHPVLDADSFGARSRDGGSVAPLTVLQYALLHHLAYLPPGKVATWFELASAMRPFDHEPITPKAVQWHAVNLRRRLSHGRYYRPPGGAPWPLTLLVTVRGRGLMLDWGIGTVASQRHAKRTPKASQRTAER